jgi:CO dehydrogenase nickel-insertion accessory protein CooC1
VSPEQLLGELEGDGQVVIGDLEAGVGTVLRLRPGMADAVVVVAQATAKSIDIAARAARMAAARELDVLVVANRVRDEGDLSLIRDGLGEYEIVAVPEDPAILRADQEGLAPLDLDAHAPGVAAIVALAERLTGSGDPALSR